MKLDKIPKKEKKKYNLEDGTPPMDWPEPLLESTDTAIFYVADRGMTFLTDFREFLKTLGKKGLDITEDDEEAIYGYVTDPVIPYQLFHHLKKDYSFESVRCAMNYLKNEKTGQANLSIYRQKRYVFRVTF